MDGSRTRKPATFPTSNPKAAGTLGCSSVATKHWHRTPNIWSALLRQQLAAGAKHLRCNPVGAAS